MSWFGRQMRTYSKGSVSANFMYDADGLRSAKAVNGTITKYQYVGDQLFYEKIGENKTLYYFYDSYGNLSQIYYTFGTGDDASTARYFVSTNAQGDVLGLYNSNGVKVGAYDYDAWGNTRMFVVTQDSDGKNVHTQIDPETQYLNHIVNVNPIRYRGYYYDSDLDLYYLQSRYYDAEIGRFINADSVVSGVGGDVLGSNMFAYCMNNPVNRTDPTGHWPEWLKKVVSWVNNNIIQPVKKSFSTSEPSSVASTSSHNANRRPYTGEPGSTYTAPNGDSRTYGEDGYPVHDYDHDDHERPDKHPHDSNGGHNHDWKDGVRGPAYSVGWEPVAGAALVTVCVIGIVVVAADDATGIGVADDFLFGPLGAGVGEGLILIFG